MKVWFTSDTHFFHKNILRHCPERISALGMEDMAESQPEEQVTVMNERLIDLWNSTVSKHDRIYIVGDLSFAGKDDNMKLVSKLRGQKYLILGNHDKSSDKQVYFSLFKDICQMKEVTFKPTEFPFLDENITTVLCHYPLLTWNRKMYGSLMVHGHCHGRLDEFNDASEDLRVDVGFDGKLANHQFVSLENLYAHFKEKTGGKLISEYAAEHKQERDN